MKCVPKVKDFMSQVFFTLGPQTNIFDAIDLFVAKKASGAPVVDDQGALVGILTEKDCLRVLTASAYNQQGGGTVKDFMSPIRMTVSPNMDLFNVAAAFLSSNFPSLPVVDKGKLIGRISRKDMLRGIQELQRRLMKARCKHGEDIDGLLNPHSLAQIQSLVGSQNREQLAEVFSKRFLNE